MDDKRHKPYLLASIIMKVDRDKKKYLVQRINDNVQEYYYYHQIVQLYVKQHHSIDLEQHKQKIQQQRINGKKSLSTISTKASKKGSAKGKRKGGKGKNKGRGTKRKTTDSDNANNIQDLPNKRRKLNDNSIDKINTNTIDTNAINAESIHANSNSHSSSNNEQSEKRNIDHGVWTIAQPYFPTVKYIIIHI